MVELQSRVEELQEEGLGLAAISYDSPEILADFSRRHGITFSLLSDADSETIKRYGILNTVAEEGLGPHANDPAVKADVRQYVTVNQPDERFRGIAFPGTFILDAAGVVTERFFEDFYRERNTASNILVKLGAGKTQVQGSQISTNHLEIKTYLSDWAVALGHRFSVVIEITPREGMHLYAPGARGYRTVAPRIESQPFVRLLPIEYPDSEIYFFKPLSEHVPVYQKPFTLLQEVVPEASREARAAFEGKDNLTLAGALEYQACDDEVCYSPVSIPLSWTVRIEPFVPRSRPR